MSGPISFRSLDGVTATGAGNFLEFVAPRAKHTMQVTLGGAVNATGVIANLEGTSQVDTNGAPTAWFTMASWNLADPRVSGEAVTVDNVLVKFVRANLATFTGGTTPSLTAEITSK